MVSPGTELIRRMATGDRDALAPFYDLYAPLAFGLLRRMLRDVDEAAEVLQEVFWELWRAAGGYDPRRGAPEAAGARARRGGGPGAASRPISPAAARRASAPSSTTRRRSRTPPPPSARRRPRACGTRSSGASARRPPAARASAGRSRGRRAWPSRRASPRG